MPDELIINDDHCTDSTTIAIKFNEYFASIAQTLNSNYSDSEVLNISKLQGFINKKVPDNIYFHIPLITTDQVQSYIQLLDSSKATGLDGLGLKIIKIAASTLSPILAALVNKSIISGTVPGQLKCAKVFPIFKGDRSLILRTIVLFLFFLQYPRYSKNM